MKKLIFLSLFSMLFLSNNICHATNYHPVIYKTIKFAKIDFDDHLKALDFFIAKWKLKKNPTRDAFGEVSYYEEPEGIAGDSATRTTIYENSKYISQLIYASRSPLLAIKKCNEQEEAILDETDTTKITEALSLFGEASDTMRNYSIRIYNINQSFQDLSDLYATRAKIVEGQAKLQEILDRRTQKN